MAVDLPFLVALPVYGIAYSLFLWCFAKAVKALREAFGAKDESSKT